MTGVLRSSHLLISPARRRILKHFGVFSALAVIIIASLSLLAFIAFSGSRQLSLYISGLSIDIPSCETLGVSGSGSWTFVGIDVRFGPLSYGQAKAADLAWNMIAGRGVATLLAILSYRVFTDALMKATEAHCVPYEVFTSLALFSTRLDKLWYLGKGLFQSPGWRVKWMIGWIFVSTIHLALFPTLMDILSGYEASNVTQLRLPSNGSILLTRSTLRRISPYNNNTLWTAYPIPGSYVMTYQWHDQTLNKSWAETVNSTFIVEYWNATYSTDGSSHAAWEKFQNDAKNFYMYNPDNYDCVLEPAVYQWGFSAEWAYVLVIVNSCWLVGLWIVWVDADHNSQLCRKRRRMGTYRAIADISEAMREDLGRNLCAYSEDELRKAVRKQGFIKYYVSNEEDGMPAHLGLSSRPSGKVKLEWGQKYGQG